MNRNINYYKSICLIIILLSCVMLFSACTNPYLSENNQSIPTLNLSDIDKPEDHVVNHEPKGNITIGLCDFDTLNPLETNNEVLRNYLSLVYESLIVYDKDCKPTYCLAENIYTYDGGISWEITIKNNILFHDKTVMTAYDVKNTIEWIINNNCYYTNSLKNINSIEILKNNVLKVSLNNCDSFFISKLNFPIIKSEDLSSDFSKLNGTGMYKHIKNLKFEVFDNYHGIYPKIKSFEIITFVDSDDLFNSDVDIMMFYEDDTIRYSKKENYTCGLYNDNIFATLIPSPKIDLNLKNYINNIIDKELIVKSVYANKATVSNIPIIEKTFYLNKHNTVKKEVDNNIILPESITFIVKNTDYDLIRLVEIIENELPLTTVTQTVICSEKEYNDIILSGEYDFALSNIELHPYPDYYDLFYTGGNNNINNFSDSSVDSLILSLTDAFKNKEISLVNDIDSFCNFTSSQIAKLAIVLEETLPVISVCQRKASIFINNRLSGISFYNFNFWNTLDSFKNIEIN